MKNNLEISPEILSLKLDVLKACGVPEGSLSLPLAGSMYLV